VPTLSLLQSLYILPTTTSVRGTNARLYFLVGPRVLANLATSLSRTRDIALEYGCQAEDVVERTKNLVVSSKESRAKEKKMGTELAEWVAKDLLDRSKAASADAKVITGFLHRDEDGTNDLEWLVALSGKIKGILDTDTTSPPHLFALAASSSQSGSSLLIFGQPESLVASAGNDIRAKFGARVKGGGKGRWQGKLVEGRWKRLMKKRSGTLWVKRQILCRPR
jgi:misacylated tRNA(Ala) deacylase